jgi:hypothetical protein
VQQLGIELLSVFGLPPVEFVNLAADLDCRYLSTGLGVGPYNPHGYPSFSLRDDAALRAEMIAAMNDRDVAIWVISTPRWPRSTTSAALTSGS